MVNLTVVRSLKINEKNDKCIYMLCRSVPSGKIEIVIIEAFYIDNL